MSPFQCERLARKTFLLSLFTYIIGAHQGGIGSQYPVKKSAISQSAITFSIFPILNFPRYHPVQYLFLGRDPSLKLRSLKKMYQDSIGAYLRVLDPNFPCKNRICVLSELSKIICLDIHTIVSYFSRLPNRKIKKFPVPSVYFIKFPGISKPVFSISRPKK